MISSVEVRNFQSLRDVRVRIGRFTVVTGPSNTGKSALVRAIRLLAFNARGSSFVTRGQKTATVVMTGDDWRVEVSRGGRDSYTIQVGEDGGAPHVFTKLGGKVPEQVTGLLRLAEVNFAGQLDRPYLLDQTGGEVTRVLGRLTNATLLHKAAQEANRRRLATAAALKAREADLTACEARLTAYAALPAEREAVEGAEVALESLRALEARRARLESLRSTVDVARAALARPVPPEPPSTAELERLAARRASVTALYAAVRSRQLEVTMARSAEEAAHVFEQEALRELAKYVAQWGVCPACGQPVLRKAAAHDHEGSAGS